MEKRFITEKEKKDFKLWLVIHDLNISKFAERCGCSVAYISQLFSGKKELTPTAQKLLEKGGYIKDNQK